MSYLQTYSKPFYLGHKDIDYEILSHLSEEDLFNACLVNKYNKSLCETNPFLKQRFMKQLRIYLTNLVTTYFKADNDTNYINVNKNVNLHELIPSLPVAYDFVYPLNEIEISPYDAYDMKITLNSINDTNNMHPTLKFKLSHQQTINMLVNLYYIDPTYFYKLYNEKIEEYKNEIREQKLRRMRVKQRQNSPNKK